MKREDLFNLKRGRKEHPAITRETLDDTLAIACTMPNRDDLLRCCTPSRVDESGEVVPVDYKLKPRQIETELQRRDQLSEAPVTGKRVKLTSYQNDVQESCAVIPAHDERSVDETIEEGIETSQFAGWWQKSRIVGASD